jgi:hypothetical protein
MKFTIAIIFLILKIAKIFRWPFSDDEDFWDVFPKGRQGQSVHNSSGEKHHPAGENSSALVKKSIDGKLDKYVSPYSRRMISETESAPKNSSELVKLERALKQQKELNK